MIRKKQRFRYSQVLFYKNLFLGPKNRVNFAIFGCPLQTGFTIRI